MGWARGAEGRMWGAGHALILRMPCQEGSIPTSQDPGGSADRTMAPTGQGGRLVPFLLSVWKKVLLFLDKPTSQSPDAGSAHSQTG